MSNADGTAPANFGARMAEKKREKAAMSTGVGESKPFGGDHERELQPGERDWSKLTLNGMPIPPEVQATLPYYYTDQAVAERESKRDPNAVRVEVLRGPEEKMIEKYRDGLMAESEPWESGIDPLLETRKRFGEPGKRYRFLSEAKVGTDGWRGWKPVETIENGVAKVVKLGKMIFGWMPEEKAQKREKFFADKAREQMVQAQERVLETVDRIADATKMRKIARRHGQAGQDEGFQSVRGDERDMNDVDFEPTARS